MANWYATYSDIETQAAIPSGTAAQAVMASFLESASRIIDRDNFRHYYSLTETRYCDGTRGDELLVPDLLSITTFKGDTNEDGTYEETWTEGTDFWLENAKQWTARFPKHIIRLTGRGSYAFGYSPRRYEIAGIWGYGDGQRAAPWDLLVPTATIATTSGTTLTLSAGTAALYTGNTIRVESEQMFVYSYAGTGTTATVERGVNGTTAAAHSTAAMYKAAYPREIVQCCKDIVVHCFVNRPFPENAAINDHDFAMQTNEETFWRQLRMIRSFRKPRFA
jgi:hypothetical protein